MDNLAPVRPAAHNNCRTDISISPARPRSISSSLPEAMPSSRSVFNSVADVTVHSPSKRSRDLSAIASMVIGTSLPAAVPDGPEPRLGQHIGGTAKSHYNLDSKFLKS